MPNSLDASYERSLLGRMVVTLVGSSSVRVAGSNPRRIGVVLCSAAGGRVTYSFGLPAVDQQGVLLGQLGNPVVLWRRDMGSLMEQDINVVSSAAGQTVTVFEISEP